MEKRGEYNSFPRNAMDLKVYRPIIKEIIYFQSSILNLIHIFQQSSIFFLDIFSDIVH